MASGGCYRMKLVVLTGGVSRVDFPEIYSPGVWIRGEGRIIGDSGFVCRLSVS